jgi:predicted RNA-binding Zn ribbon-like protein
LSESRKAAKESQRNQPKRFDLIAGNVCLDFVNTLDDRPTQPKETLLDYMDLVHFAEEAGVLDSDRANQLYERGYLDPLGAQEVLARGRELREALHQVFWATIHKRPVPPAALARINADVQDAATHLSLVPAGRGAKSGFEWKYDELRQLDRVLWPIARAAADLFTSEQLADVRACGSKTCEWLFLDTSKNRHRRWCDMTRCGNRAKMQRFYARQKKRA